MEMEMEMEMEIEQQLSEIQQKISTLSNVEGMELRSEMASLKRALLANPEACAFLLPEDIGACVQALKRMLGVAVKEASMASTKTRKTKPRQQALTKEELKKAMEELDDADFNPPT